MGVGLNGFIRTGDRRNPRDSQQLWCMISSGMPLKQQLLRGIHENLLREGRWEMDEKTVPRDKWLARTNAWSKLLSHDVHLEAQN
jgi:hypothetical protein